MKFYLTLFAALFFTACDQSTAPAITQAQTSCSAEEAQIRISDGYFQNLCGCAEPSAVTTSGTFTCTVKVGTTVFFLYLDTHLSHQIISTGGEAFASGGLYQPGSNTNTNVAPEFNTAGTADFEDAFDTNIQGQIVVTP
jgi:plastocyanin